MYMTLPADNIIFVADLHFIELNESLAPVYTLRKKADVSSRMIMIDMGFPTFNRLGLHLKAYVSCTCVYVMCICR